MQTDFWGTESVAGNVVDRIDFLLETFPEARDSYMTLIARATSPKTIQNRAMEIQRRKAHLDASPAVLKTRARQAKAGPVR
jgi:hypothetical protein